MERYYYDYRGGSEGSSGRDGRPSRGGFLFPFVLFIIIGVVLVLGFELYFKFFDSGDGNAVLIQVTSGQAQIKMWGTPGFSKVYSGTKILPGDEIYVGQNSRAVVTFPDGTILRLNGDTDVVFDSTSRVSLVKGEIWANKTFTSACENDFSVFVKNVVAKSLCGIFDVSFYGTAPQGGVEELRAIMGAMEIDVYSRNGGVVVDHVQIKEGEQASFDNEKLEKFWLFQAPNVIEPIDDGFKSLEWYGWNVLADESGDNIEFINGSEEAAIEPADGAVDEVVSEAAVDETSVLDETVPEVVADEAPVVLGEFKDPIISEINAIPWDYSMFEKGIEVKDSLSIKITGKAYGAEKIFINNYQLQKFTPSSGEEVFTYWLEEKYENLKAGENVYEVYSTAPDGARSNSVYFKVIYTPPEVDDLVGE